MWGDAEGVIEIGMNHKDFSIFSAMCGASFSFRCSFCAVVVIMVPTEEWKKV